MLAYSELQKGVIIIVNDQPYEIVEASSVFKGRGHSYLQTKLKNLRNGSVLSKTIQPRDTFEEADVQKKDAEFIYANKGKYVFAGKDNPSNRIELTEEQIGTQKQYLKEKCEVEMLIFNGEIINIKLPIKVQLKVTEVPPGVKGDRAQGGTKTVTLETGSVINVPLFVEQDDIIEINTERDEYVRRVQD